jgi:hypothetical protein
VHSGAPESCDERDDDCDAQVDEDAIDQVEVPLDLDADGLGDRERTAWTCTPSDLRALDCDDADPAEPVIVDVTAAPGGDGTAAAPYGTIQIGIDSGARCVLVHPGTYPENLDFNGQDVDVSAAEGKATTRLEGASSDPVVTFANAEGPGAVLRGFTVTGGAGALVSVSWFQTCPDVDAPCTITSVAFYGGGVYISDASPTLWDLDIVDNVLPAASTTQTSAYAYTTVSSNGGGVYVAGGAPTLRGVTLRGNSASEGGGLYLYGATVTLAQVRVTESTAGLGAGLLADTVALTATNLVLSENTATGSGGGASLYTSNSDWENVTLAGNAALQGSGLFVSGGTLVLSGAIVAYGSGGAGIQGRYAEVRAGAAWSRMRARRCPPPSRSTARAAR